MSGEYQLRKDIDRFNSLINGIEFKLGKKLDAETISQLLDLYYDKSGVDTEIGKVMHRLGLDQESSDKFNYAVIKKTEGTGVNQITYEELWILSNAYYDYDLKRFVKIDGDHTSFGVQIQANGSYPGEAALGYNDNVGINIWRNPKKSDVAAAFPNWESDTFYDFSFYMGDTSYIGLGVRSTGAWLEYGYMAGWSNSFMIDSYGGMTIGGAGFEVDGNGIYPFTRLTSSRYTDSNNQVWYLLGLLDNAYHPTKWGWECDDNSTYSWFIGLRTPEASDLVKDNTSTSFVVMYNDTSYNSSNTHELDVDNWHIVFEVNVNGIVQ